MSAQEEEENTIAEKHSQPSQPKPDKENNHAKGLLPLTY
jgi:hypothetical protein